MGRFKIEEPNKKVKWVKSIDYANETLEFTENEREAYNREGDFFTVSELEFLKFHFKEKYPEVNYATTNSRW